MLKHKIGITEVTAGVSLRSHGCEANTRSNKIRNFKVIPKLRHVSCVGGLLYRNISESTVISNCNTVSALGKNTYNWIGEDCYRKNL